MRVGGISGYGGWNYVFPVSPSLAQARAEAQERREQLKNAYSRQIYTKHTLSIAQRFMDENVRTYDGKGNLNAQSVEGLYFDKYI